MSKTIFIGDVHGCLTELDLLLDQVCFRHMDRLVFVGDLIDKGPNSAGVVERVLDMREAGYKVDLVLGNHEEMHLRWLRKRARGDGSERVMARDAEFRAMYDRTALHEALDASLALALFESAVPYIKFDFDGRRVLAVHGGIPTELQDLPEDPKEVDRLPKSERKYIERLCRTRFIDENGEFVATDKVEAHHTFWARHYDGRFGTVIFGHHPFSESVVPRRFMHATGIDLGCCFGGHLCALTIWPNGTESVKVVPAQRPYAPKFIEAALP